MKIKKFKNLWLMGIIIMCTLLVGFELLKIINPHFIIKIAEIESVVKFGNYVQTHEWAYYIFVFTTSFVSYWLLCCACCRKKSLNWKQTIIVAIATILLLIIQRFLNQYYYTLNILGLFLVPMFICFMDNCNDRKYFISTFSVLLIHNVAQILSLEIRNLTLMITFPNIVTVTILLIDVYIWEVLLYNYFNYKENK